MNRTTQTNIEARQLKNFRIAIDSLAFQFCFVLFFFIKLIQFLKNVINSSAIVMLRLNKPVTVFQFKERFL